MSQALDSTRVPFERLLLPDGVQESVAPASWHLEEARRALLDLYWRWGFDLVRPPLIEYLDSLLTGAGADLDLQTFKLTDQVNGRNLGIRADITTQVARIDAQRLTASGPARYCYIGSVLRTRAEEPGGSRAPLQVGAEKFGDASLSADKEVVSLMLESLRLLDIEGVGLDLGHVRVYRRLVERAKLDVETESRLFDVVQRKSRPDLDVLASEGAIGTQTHDRIACLIELHGGPDTLGRAREILGGIDSDIDCAIDDLDEMVSSITAVYSQCAIFLDFAELHGYRYKTGLLFAAFAPGRGRELARGGRYDDVGQVLGHGRPATGFSADLNVLVERCSVGERTAPSAVFAPANDDDVLACEIARLRQAGWRVITASPGAEDDEAVADTCDHVLTWLDGRWQIETRSKQQGSSS